MQTFSRPCRADLYDRLKWLFLALGGGGVCSWLLWMMTR